MINEFRGKYYFLSNFSSAKVQYEGFMFENNEAAFQAQKDLSQRSKFCNLPPNEAKRLGRRVNLRKDWEDVKDKIMYEIVFNKFSQNPELKKKLLATNGEELVEGNTWNDQYWGVCNGKGKNMLGKILMRVRAELRKERFS